MRLEQFRSRFEKSPEKVKLNYLLGEALTKDKIAAIENKLKILFPEQVSLFYEHFNGLKVDSPNLEIFPIEKLKFVAESRLNFAVIDGKHQLFFDTSHLNEADQWDILSEADFRITLTMASFWSNKIWAWIERGRSIWKEEFENHFS